MANSVTFTGISGIQRCKYTCTLGTTADAAILWCKPQVISSARGTLVLSDGVTSLTLTDCLCKETSGNRSGNGWLQCLQIFDRRWKWDFGCALGTWNVRLEDGTVDPATQKSARELVSLLFYDASNPTFGMGESGVDVSAVPDDDYPPVDWVGEKARVACDRILRKYGLDVAFDPGTDSVSVVALGSGTGLPTNQVESYTLSASFEPYPDNIQVWTGPWAYETKFKVQYVAPDTDGAIKEIDDLSFAPAGGWEGNFTNPLELIPESTDPLAYGLANRWVGRMFQIVEVADGTLELADGTVMDSIQQALPLLRTRLLHYSDGDEQYRAEPLLEGVFVTGKAPDSLANTPNGTEYDGRLRIDGLRGIVTTRTPLWKLNAGLDGYEKADLYLTIAHLLQDSTKNFVRYFKSANIASNGTPTEQRTREDIRREIRGVWDGLTLDSTVDNQTDLDATLDLELDAWAASYAGRTGTTVRFGWIQQIVMNGKVQVASWSVDKDDGAITMAAENTEFLLGVKPRKWRVRDSESEPRSRSSMGRRKRRRRGEDE